jgi:hypothetical protein
MLVLVCSFGPASMLATFASHRNHHPVSKLQADRISDIDPCSIGAVGQGVRTGFIDAFVRLLLFCYASCLTTGRAAGRPGSAAGQGCGLCEPGGLSDHEDSISDD